jgi:DnaJ-class molecular chaperone
MASYAPPQTSISKTNHYDLLGVSLNASEEDIKKAYHAKAREYHPDKTLNSSSEEMMKKINKAKSVLIDHAKRLEYDEELLDDENGPTVEAEFALPFGEWFSVVLSDPYNIL